MGGMAPGTTTAGIEEWMERFEHAWTQQDIDAVLDLFTPGVEYHETPTQELEDRDAVRNEWEAIHDQQDIELDWSVYASDGDRHTVRWELDYINEGNQHHLAGIYLIELDDEGHCTTFWQYCDPS